MSALVRIYKIKEFIRINETGIIDVEYSKQLILLLAGIAAFHVGDNILLDLRDTTIGDVNTGDILEIASEFNRHASAFQGKIVNVIPDDENRILVAEQLKAILDLDPHRYKVFTSFEEAINWLSDIENLGN